MDEGQYFIRHQHNHRPVIAAQCGCLVCSTPTARAQCILPTANHGCPPVERKPLLLLRLVVFSKGVEQFVACAVEGCMPEVSTVSSSPRPGWPGAGACAAVLSMCQEVIYAEKQLRRQGTHSLLQQPLLAGGGAGPKEDRAGQEVRQSPTEFHQGSRVAGKAPSSAYSQPGGGCSNQSVDGVSPPESCA